MKTVKTPLLLAGILAALLAGGCTPHENGSCDPAKDSSYLYTHTVGGKTVATQLECEQVGANRYEWRKVS